MTETKKISIIVLCFLISIGCGVNSIPQARKIQVNPPFDNGFIKSIAVIEFSNSTDRKGAGKILADRVEQLLLNESPYKVLSRMDIDRVMDERKIKSKAQGELSSSMAQEIGKILGVTALIVGNVENYNFVCGKDANQSTVVITFKLLNTADGSVVWSKTAHGEAYGTLSEYACYDGAIKNLLKDVRGLFPHEEEAN